MGEMRTALLWAAGIVLFLTAAGFVAALAITSNLIYLVPAAILGATAKLVLSRAAGLPNS